MNTTASPPRRPAAQDTLVCRRRSAARIRPYITTAVPPCPGPVAPAVLRRVLHGLRALDLCQGAFPPRPVPREQASEVLAAQLAPLAHRLRVVRPGAWAPAAVNAPDPDVTSTVPLPVVRG